jgi:hypothetical protein
MKLWILHESREHVFTVPESEDPVYKIQPSRIREGEEGWYNPGDNTAYVWSSGSGDWTMMAAIAQLLAKPESTPDASPAANVDLFNVDRFGKVSEPTASEEDWIDGIRQNWAYFRMEASPGLQRAIWKQQGSVPTGPWAIHISSSVESAKALLSHLPNVKIAELQTAEDTDWESYATYMGRRRPWEYWRGDPRDFIELGLSAPETLTTTIYSRML